MTFLDFNSLLNTLQGNPIEISVTKAKDKTKYTPVNEYRYYFEYTPIYGFDNKTIKAPNYAGYNDGQWSRTAYTYITDATSSLTFSLKTIVPTLNYDSVVRFRVEAKDESGQYYDNQISGIFLAFSNRRPEAQCVNAMWVGDNVELECNIKHPGILYPINFETIDYSNAMWTKYCQIFYSKFPNYAISIGWGYSASNTPDPSHVFKLKDVAINSGLWHYGPTQAIIENAKTKLNPQASNYLFFYGEGQYTAAKPVDYNYVWQGKAYSTVILLQNVTPSIQIKRRAIKVHMPKDDPNLKTASTGAGMFNHNNLVGFDPNLKKPDATKGHSIALYDTFAQSGGTPRNQPSIGFFNEVHQPLGIIQIQKDSTGKYRFKFSQPIDAEITGSGNFTDCKVSNKIILTDAEGDKAEIYLVRENGMPALKWDITKV